MAAVVDRVKKAWTAKISNWFRIRLIIDKSTAVYDDRIICTICSRTVWSIYIHIYQPRVRFRSGNKLFFLFLFLFQYKPNILSVVWLKKFHFICANSNTYSFFLCTLFWAKLMDQKFHRHPYFDPNSHLVVTFER